MKATFAQLPRVIRAAAERAGLSVITSPQAAPGWEGDLWISQEDSYPVHVLGTPHTVMRLIGALADDGQDCLLGVTS